MSQDFVKGSEAQPTPRPSINDPYSAWWELHRRSKKRINEESEICPKAGPQEFVPDGIRYCMKGLHGSTCSSFRAKPFNNCPKFRD